MVVAGLVPAGADALAVFGVLSAAALADRLLFAGAAVFGAAGAGFAAGSSGFATGAGGFTAGGAGFVPPDIAAPGAGVARGGAGRAVSAGAAVRGGVTGADGAGAAVGAGGATGNGVDVTAACCEAGGFTASRMYGTATAPTTPRTIRMRTARNHVAAKIERGGSSSYVSGSSSSLRSSRSGLIGLDSAISCTAS
ncbi:MAG: hypothetical protein WED01_10305 [Candidatus Rokuibacteriota bacterium]